MVSFIDRLRTKGTVMPSSRFLVRRMLAKIDAAQNRDILQLGYGTGVFTRALLEMMTPVSTLTVFEVDHGSRRHIVGDRRLRYIEDSAEFVSRHCGDQQFDCIISTLPLASLPKPVTEGILAASRVHLRPGGTFLQYQYSLLSRRLMRSLFGTEPTIDFELRNFPPAFIYEVRRPF